ncbi:MAG: amidohydrolase family protein, partial [Ilumatobacteraceae bacterium]
MENIDLLIRGWYVVTMNESRDVIRDGAVAVRGDQIVDVGKRVDLEAKYAAARVVGGDHFVVTPGLVNTHIHITGEPLTRGYVPDDTPFEENVFMWLCPLYSVFTAEEERLSGQLAAVEMLKSGTTTFLEAGTIRFLDEVLDGLVEVGIRGRVGRWVWDLPPEPDVYKQNTDEAVAFLE